MHFHYGDVFFISTGAKTSETKKLKENANETEKNKIFLVSAFEFQFSERFCNFFSREGEKWENKRRKFKLLQFHPTCGHVFALSICHSRQSEGDFHPKN